MIKQAIMEFIRKIIKENGLTKFDIFNVSVDDTENCVNMMNVGSHVTFYKYGKVNIEPRNIIEFSDPELFEKIESALLTYKW